MQRTLTQPGALGRLARRRLDPAYLVADSGVALPPDSSAPVCLVFCSGTGSFGGMAGFASVFGLMLQIVLVVIVARLLFAWWQRRNAPVPALRQRNRRLAVIRLAVSAACSVRMHRRTSRSRSPNPITTI
jgi:hypothetical protein